MARVKSAVTKRKRHKKILKQAKGYFGHKHIGFRSAKEQVRKSNEYAFRDRKQVKREMRKLWIKRINAATRIYETSYSQFMNGLKKAEIEINRKMLADIAVNDLEQFGHLVNEARAALVQDAVDVAAIASTFNTLLPKKETKKPDSKAKPTKEKEEVKEEPKTKEESKTKEAKEESKTKEVKEEPKTKEVKEGPKVKEESRTTEVKKEFKPTEPKDDLDTVSDEAEAKIVEEAIKHGEELIAGGESITGAVQEAVEEVIEKTKKAVAEADKK